MMETCGSRPDELCEMAVIVNKKGLHARAAAKFVQLASTFDAKLFVGKDDMRVAGDSIMGLMMLAASEGSCLRLCASGPEALRAITALVDLIKRGFDEE